MRAIDADAFDERVRAAGGMSEEELTEDFKDGVQAVLYMLSNQPTIQPDIVRCKDCKYARLTDDGSCKYCDIWFPDEAEYMDGDYYCASAERKSNG